MKSLFFSYSHVDEDLRNRLEVHLAMLKRQGIIDVWHDRRIMAGDDLDASISAELDAADVILLLVSPDFLASTYCYEREMTRALERESLGEARVIPIILRPCDWQSAPFSTLLVTPTDGTPVTKFADLDDAFLQITNAIRTALQRDGPRRTRAATQPADTPFAVKPLGDSGPRSSNLRLKKTFTDVDKDRFRDEGFEFIARFFENSLQELRARNPGIETTFKRIDSQQFTAAVYRGGKSISRCRIFMGHAFLSSGIAYSASDWGGGTSVSESLSVEAAEQGLFFRSMGMASHSTSSAHLTFEGAAEYYWSLLIGPLQQ